jgi:integrase
MAFRGETPEAAVRAEAAGASDLAAAYSAFSPLPARGETIRDIVALFRAAPDGFGRLQGSTPAEWSRKLDEIVAEFGTMPVKALKARGVRNEFVRWRDSKASTPRAADYGIQVLKRLLSWALEHEHVDENPAEGIRTLWRSANRADVMVTDAELSAILGLVTVEAGRAIRLAAATRMRRGDLISLKWDDVGENSLAFSTRKSGGRRRALVPLHGDGRTVIDELRRERDLLVQAGRVPSSFLLTSDRGQPWAKDSLTQAFGRATGKLGIKKDLHDLRGTAVTRFVNAGLSDEQVAEIVGWEPTKVRQIRRHYVDRNNVAASVIEQLERAKATG